MVTEKHNVARHKHTPRLVAREKNERTETVTIGRRRKGFSDAYARLLDAPWSHLALSIITGYLIINMVFTLLYLAVGNGIENARPGSFSDAFFFSVQTLATIGYGKMAPRGLAANMLVTIEALLGFCFLAVMTGLVFSKFSRPTSRVIFSNVAVICPFNGVPHLMLRVANERGNRIVDANISLYILRMEKSVEGLTMRRFHDLPLVRNRLPLLQLTWMAMHPIDEKSPLYNTSPEKLKEQEVEIIVSLSGIDETLSQTVHARYSYLSEEIICNAVFEDIIRRTEDHKIEINYSLIDQYRRL